DSLPPRDTTEVLAIFAEHRAVTGDEALARSVLADTRLWGRAIDHPALSSAVARGLSRLQERFAFTPDLPSLLALAG
ncbi:MAG TPA: hypothetical protein VK146_04325, partial [Tabrizicola sp.]|nr:hypothetical protein [Tabrizicola sp.]